MAGPPVEVQVRLKTGVAASSNWKAISPGIVTCPVEGTNITQSVAFLITLNLEEKTRHAHVVRP